MKKRTNFKKIYRALNVAWRTKRSNKIYRALRIASKEGWSNSSSVSKMIQRSIRRRRTPTLASSRFMPLGRV